MSRWRIPKLACAIALTLLLLLNPIAMGSATAARSKEPPKSAAKLAGKLTETSPPGVIQELRPALEDYQPQVKILSPRANEVLNDNTVSIRFQVNDLPLFKDQKLGLGPHLHVFLDNQPYQAVYDVSRSLELTDLAPGTHTLRVFASRPWHESFKNEGAYAQTTFHVFAKTNDAPDPNLPLLTYSRPQASYGAEPIMLDFYLTNAPLHLVAQEDAKDDIADWRIRCTVNGDSFVIDRWQPIYLKGFKPGKNWVQLEFLDDKGNPVKNEFNNTVRVITYEPNGKDTLSKLTRGELSAAQARGIVDATYQPPPEAPEPSPEVKIPPVVLPTPAPSPEPSPVPQSTQPTTVPDAPAPIELPSRLEAPEAPSNAIEVIPPIDTPPSQPASPKPGFFNRLRPFASKAKPAPSPVPAVKETIPVPQEPEKELEKEPSLVTPPVSQPSESKEPKFESKPELKPDSEPRSEPRPEPKSKLKSEPKVVIPAEPVPVPSPEPQLEAPAPVPAPIATPIAKPPKPRVKRFEPERPASSNPTPAPVPSVLEAPAPAAEPLPEVDLKPESKPDSKPDPTPSDSPIEESPAIAPEPKPTPVVPPAQPRLGNRDKINQMFQRFKPAPTAPGPIVKPSPIETIPPIATEATPAEPTQSESTEPEAAPTPSSQE